MPTIAVIGAGYAGVSASRTLSAELENEWRVVMLDRHPWHELTTRLPEVAGGLLAPELSRVPLVKVIDARVNLVTAEVHTVDDDAGKINSGAGAISYDYCIYCLGSAPDFLNIPGAANFGLPMRSVEQAQRINEVITRHLNAHDNLSVVVVGAGYTGTEVAGELAYWNERLRSRRHQGIEITVIAQDDQLLAEGNVRLGQLAERVLRKKGVDFILGTSVERVCAEGVWIGSRLIPAQVVIWAAHSAANSASAQEWPLGVDQRIKTDPYLRVLGSHRILAAGDAALTYDYARDSIAPSNAQLAIQEGEVAARNLIAMVHGRPMREFQPHMAGEALSLGGKDGAAEVSGVVVSGRLAMFAKQAALIRYLTRIGGIQLASNYVKR